MSLFFTADTHLGHANILAYSRRWDFLTEEEIKSAKKDPRCQTWRPSYESVARMNNEFISQINKMVGENDTLWHLGDFAFGPRVLAKLLPVIQGYRDQIKCKNIQYVLGNHDDEDAIRRVFEYRKEDRKGNPILDHRENEQWIGVYEAKVNQPIKHNHQKITVSHYAHAVWNKSHRGAWNIYGHSHTSAERWLENAMPGRRAIDVGVDNAKELFGVYRPFSFTDLLNIMDKREGHSIDHHKSDRYE